MGKGEEREERTIALVAREVGTAEAGAVIALSGSCSTSEIVGELRVLAREERNPRQRAKENATHDRWATRPSRRPRSLRWL